MKCRNSSWIRDLDPNTRENSRTLIRTNFDQLFPTAFGHFSDRILVFENIHNYGSDLPRGVKKYIIYFVLQWVIPIRTWARLNSSQNALRNCTKLYKLKMCISLRGTWCSCCFFFVVVTISLLLDCANYERERCQMNRNHTHFGHNCDTLIR